MTRFITSITEFSYRKAWLVIIILVGVVAYGSYTILRVDQELIPDIEFPILPVIVEAPGMQPGDVERDITIPIENAVADLDGLDSFDSTSVGGLAVVLLQYDFGQDLDQAELDIRTAIEDVNLPANATVDVLKFDPSTLPIVEFSLQGDLTQAELTDLAQSAVVPNLKALDGVADVEVVGGALREVLVTVDRGQMLEAGLTYDGIASALSANNVILASGQLESPDATIPLETVSVYQTIDDMAGVQLVAADGSTLSLGDIATIEQQQALSTGRTRTDGQPSVGIRVAKEKSANTVSTAHKVTDELEELELTLPAGTSFEIFQDQSEFIEESVNGVIVEGLIGGVLAILIVFAFLANWRTTLVTAVSIPLSLVIAIMLLDYMGYSLNVMTLAGLTIAIGRVIDDSIVVLENSYRHMAMGESTFASILNGTREVTIAILGATAATCAVFLPLGLTGGFIGQLFLPFSLAVVFSLIASLLVAITIIPVLIRFTLGGRVKVEKEKVAGDWWLNKLYTPVLKLALRHRWKTLGVAGGMFVGSLMLIPLLPVVFFPGSGEKIVDITVTAEPGETQDAVIERAIEVEDLIVATYDDEVKNYQTVITGASGDFSALGNIISGENPNSATVTFEFENSVGDTKDLAEDLRELFAGEFANADTLTVSTGSGGFGPAENIAVTVSATTPDGVQHLESVANEIAAAIESAEDTANVRADVGNTQRTIQIEVDSQAAADAGVSTDVISTNLSNLSSQAQVTSVNFGEGPLAVRLVTSGADAGSIEELGALEIVSGVRLDQVATLTEVEKQVSITRVDGLPAATITADITGDDTAAVSADATKLVDAIPEPDGIEIKSGGIADDINQGFTDMLIAIAASIVIVYTLMALLFKSWLDPFAILFTLPLAVIGAIVALVVTGSPLSMSAMIGLLMLVGIVVTNAIVMLEFVQALHLERGYRLYDALIEGAQTRLRPILMTALSALLAVVPLSLGLTEGALIASDLGRVVIGGLFSSTLLTLFVVPVVYSLINGWKLRWNARRAPADEKAKASALRAQESKS